MESKVPAINSGSVLAEKDLEVPIIDLAGLRTGNAADRLKVANELRKAAETWSLFMVINHGVPENLTKRLQEESLRFFSLPLELKIKMKNRCPGPNIRLLGYDDLYVKEQQYKDLDVPLKQSLAGLCHPKGNVPESDTSLWSPWTSSLRDAIMENHKAVKTLGLQILELFAESFGLQPDVFSQHFYPGVHHDHVGSWRLHHFPAHPAPGNRWRAVCHSDPTVLTLVNQNVGALEVKKPGTDDWFTVKALPEAYVINIGDILQAWSNGRFPSANHRVFRKPDVERFSSVYFFEIDPSVRIEAPEGLIDEAHPALYVPFTGRNFRDNFDKIKPLGDISRGKALEFALRDPTVTGAA